MITNHPVSAVHLFDMALPAVKYCVGQKRAENNIILYQDTRDRFFSKTARRSFPSY